MLKIFDNFIMTYVYHRICTCTHIKDIRRMFTFGNNILHRCERSSEFRQRFNPFKGSIMGRISGGSRRFDSSARADGASRVTGSTLNAPLADKSSPAADLLRNSSRNNYCYLAARPSVPSAAFVSPKEKENLITAGNCQYY